MNPQEYQRLYALIEHAVTPVRPTFAELQHAKAAAAEVLGILGPVLIRQQRDIRRLEERLQSAGLDNVRSR